MYVLQTLIMAFILSWILMSATVYCNLNLLSE